jgi:nitrite reductase/ring-hydroxylating ferredoxin subunit
VLNGRELTCPWHGWRWDATSGRNCWPGTDWRVSRVPVRVSGAGEIQLPVL